jgi:hypothetical protein
VKFYEVRRNAGSWESDLTLTDKLKAMLMAPELACSAPLADKPVGTCDIVVGFEDQVCNLGHAHKAWTGAWTDGNLVVCEDCAWHWNEYGTWDVAE